jgi:hypothetical protein
MAARVSAASTPAAAFGFAIATTSRGAVPAREHPRQVPDDLDAKWMPSRRVAALETAGTLNPLSRAGAHFVEQGVGVSGAACERVGECV